MQRRSVHSLTVFLVLVVAGLAACERRGGCTGPNCGTLIDAAVAEPGTLLPPSSEDIVANDIGEQLFLKLADVGMSENTLGDEDFQPLLAQKWEWDGPLTLVSYAWDGTEPEAFIEPVAVGQTLIDMSLFLTANRYVNVPLEPTYQTAYRGMPEFWRHVLEQAPPEAEDQPPA